MLAAGDSVSRKQIELSFRHFPSSGVDFIGERLNVP